MSKSSYAVVIPTRRCNLRCRHCFRTDYSGPELQLDLLERFLKELATHGITHIALTGGEPTVHEKFDHMLKLLVKHGFTFNIGTNGQAVDRIRSLLEYRPNITRVMISLDGPTAAINDNIRGKGAFRNTMNTISVLSGRIPVTLKTCITTQNVEHLPEVFRMADAYDVQEVRAILMNPTVKGRERKLIIPLNDRQRLISTIRKLRNSHSQGRDPRYDMYPQLWPKAICDPAHPGLNAVALLPDGRVSLCCDLYDYDYDESLFHDENRRLSHVLGDHNNDSLDTVLDRKHILFAELLQRRKQDEAKGLLVGERSSLCENCRFYFFGEQGLT
jgi:MoaA/NifB/PqqE/SkfB family radical SAM enzyme